MDFDKAFSRKPSLIQGGISIASELVASILTPGKTFVKNRRLLDRRSHKEVK
jgi:hypothetical protein